MKIKGLDSYFGGKGGSGTYQTIINQIRPHKYLIIPFLGNCGIVRNIARADNTICCDKSRLVTNCWKAANIDKIALLNQCGIELLEKEYFLKNKSVIYCDPPYPLSSRKSGKKYEFEMTDDEHIRLLKTLKKQECDVLISTYKNNIYSDMLKDWRLIKFKSMTRNGLATEYLYCNFPEPTELHDYSFLGKDFRQRERISKKIKRHTERLISLPTLERKAILKSLIAADITTY